MKILINLVGLSHHDVGNGFHSYKNSYENLFINLVEPLRENHHVDFYIQTYDTEEKNNLEKIYNPIYSNYIELKKEKSSAFETYISSINKLKEFDYDFYIVTRFDLWIGEKINLEFDKFNFLFKEKDWWVSHYLTNDTFYGFPKSMLNSFVSTCITCRNKNGQPGYLGLFHKLYTELITHIDSSQINFIDEEHTNVQSSEKYKLSRYL